MASRISISKHIKQKSIEDFVQYESYITRQLDTVNNSNIPYMKCKINKDPESGLEKITYYESEFNTFDGLLQKIGKMPTVRTEKNAELWEQLNQYDDSPTQIFMNEYENGYFHPQIIKFNGDLYNTVLNTIGKNNLNNIEQIEICNDAFQNKFNEVFTGEFVDNVFSHWLSNKVKDEYITNVYQYCKTGRSVCGLNNIYFRRDGIEHTLAIVYWCEGEMLHCAIYDPMYYERDKSSYTKPITAACLNIQILCKRHSIPLTMYNLSKLYCVKNDKGYHCVQYVIDAEYCKLFSLYFIYLYGKHGFPKSVESLRPVVNETFISSPSNIKRNPCIATNKFRLVFMSFILTVFTIGFDNIEILTEVKNVYDNVAKSEYTNDSSTIQKPSYLLLEPSILNLLERKISATFPLPNSPLPNYGYGQGGYRRHRTRKLKKRKRSLSKRAY